MTGNRLWTLETVRGFALKARDGTLGSVEDLLFEERSWTVRWLVVDTGTWLHGRRVAIAVTALGPPDEEAECFPADLTCRQVADSPDLPGDRPLGHTGEAALHAHYGWVSYWNGAPLAPALPKPPAGTASAERDEAEPGLLSGQALEGFTVEAADGPLGEVADLGVAY